MKYTVLGINSGLGVSLFPFKAHVIGNIETRGLFHTAKNEQWKLNFGDVPLYKVFPEEPFKPTVIISSPDCGNASVFRLSRAKVLGNHQNNHSLLEFFRAIQKFKPKFFLFENLEGLFKTFPKEQFQSEVADYNLIIHTASVSRFGNSQKTRKRLVIVGIKKTLEFHKLKKYFKLPDYSDRIKTCDVLYENTLGSLSGNVREDPNTIISIHARKRMSLIEIQDEWLTRLKGKKRWTVEGGNFKTAPGVYRNLKNDYPATARKANRQYNHKGLTLTPRQLARIQGVPDDFQIYIDTDKLNYWINKARTCVTKTPPYEISAWFKRKLEKSYKIWQV